MTKLCKANLKRIEEAEKHFGFKGAGSQKEYLDGFIRGIKEGAENEKKHQFETAKGFIEKERAALKEKIKNVFWNYRDREDIELIMKEVMGVLDEK